SSQPKHSAPFRRGTVAACLSNRAKAPARRFEKRRLGDLNQALLNVMVYPHPDGVRPNDLAERTNMTRQATNYLIGQLEALGYLERRAQRGSNRRLVYLTRRGWESIDCHRAAVLELEKQWAKAIGQRRFDAFKTVLAELVALEIDSAE